MMHFKPGVKVNGIKPEMIVALIVINACGGKQGAVITSVVEGTHSRGSLHYVGYALDVRIRDRDADEVLMLVKKIRECLTDEYDVILEDTHIHIEFQPKGYTGGS